MHCRCTVVTLRSFIRNVAQIDLVAAPQPSYTHRLSRTTIRRLETYAPESKKDAAAPPSIADWEKNRTAFSSALADISPDTLDQLLAEADTEAENSDEGLLEQEPTAQPTVTSTSSTMPIASTSRSSKSPLQELLAEVPKKREPEIRSFTRLVNEGTITRPKFTGLDLKRSTEPTKTSEDDWTPPPREPWMIEKERMKEKYPDGYRPLKRLSPDAIEGIRALHAQMPDNFSTAHLAKEFAVSPEAIRRILKSKWRPNSEEEADRVKRWQKRGEKVWSRWAEMGADPSGKWQRLGIGAKPKQEAKPFVKKQDSKPFMKKRNSSKRPFKRPSKYEYQPDPLPQLITTRRTNSGGFPSSGGSDDIL